MMARPHCKASTWLLVAALLVAAQPSFAQQIDDARRRELVRHSTAAMADYAEDGYAIRELQMGALKTGESYYFTTQLSAGIDYVFYAAGDADLKGVEIRIFDENWQLVTADNRQLRQAEAMFQVFWSGSYHVQVTIADAGSEGAGWFLLTGYR
ncbi:hypothetical protein DPQ33_01615 [Oceanidesulfovibrio indonesiensis]|uniref:Peptidase C-terminal archaeal/bacterial domain-containing protein n=1 Tax=Oceanidesulfovibrio indonesiensis TaxID=54767 RepID=A0A7M3MJG2_9BACT|nr:hypothetical protein [Oceanidesulfovibrio indonesiensis]TVM19949.1 hypothetical protein DPQ33_01615 [Oceanidesulfovibrio indonesiensis]